MAIANRYRSGMTAGTLALLALAGVGAGLAGTIAGLASLVSYPALLAAGLGPVAANVTNTVALVGNAVGGLTGSRPELRGQSEQVRRLLPPAVLGGLVGGGLLLVTDPGVFERIVPWLIGFGSLAVLFRPDPERLAQHAHRHRRLLWWGVLAVSVYGGFFGAAAGVLMLAMLIAAGGYRVAVGSAIRTAVLAAANGVAAVSFAIFGPVDWPAAAACGAGFVMGSRIGPRVLRRAPDRVMRILIAAAGLALAVKLGLDAF